jgi:uncharacterized membrane protein YphA (DoxX/SURF4 family)
MNFIYRFICWLNRMLDGFRVFDFLAPLAIRLYLAPIFFVAGMNKYADLESTTEWFGNAEWGLGLPYADILAKLATGTEIIGAVLLVLGLAVRWVSIPLMITMAVAALKVHFHNGWQFIADTSSAFASPKLGPLAFEDMSGTIERLQKAREILQEHGNYGWLTEKGNIVISNNGMEMAVTYFIMLLVLFFMGGGKVFSIDFWLRRRCPQKKIKTKTVVQPEPPNPTASSIAPAADPAE